MIPHQSPPPRGNIGKDGVTPDPSLRDERLSSFEDLFGEKRVLALPDVFKPAQAVLKAGDKTTLRLDNENANIAPNLLFIQGRAGIGKTTCVRYCAYQWSIGKLWCDIEWLFVVNFRGLRSLHLSRNISSLNIPLWEWIYRHSAVLQSHAGTYGSNESSTPHDPRQTQDKPFVSSFEGHGVEQLDFQKFWDDLIASKPEKVALILDGLDEAPDIKDAQPLWTILLDPTERYAKCKVMVTSRPGLENILPKKRRNVEIIGLTNDNIEKYIQNFFIDGTSPKPEQDEKSKTMVQTLRKRPTLWGMAHIPVTLNLMCGLFEDAQDNFDDLHSMSGIYYQMESKLYILAAKRLIPLLKARDKESIKDCMINSQERYARKYYEVHRQILAQLALRGLQAEEIILPEEWLDNAIDSAIEDGLLLDEDSQRIKEELLNIGVLKHIVRQDEPSTCRTDLEFMHLTFQEYYSAVAVSEVFKDQQAAPTQIKCRSAVKTQRFIDEALLNPRYQILFWMTMGLLKESPHALGRFFEKLIDDESSPTRDLIGEYRLGLLVRGVEEVFPSSDTEIHPFTPHPLPDIDNAVQEKLFSTLLTRLNEWYAASYETNQIRIKGHILSPANSFFMQMLALSPTTSRHLSLKPENIVLTRLQSCDWIWAYESRLNALDFIKNTKYIAPNILEEIAKKLTDTYLPLRNAMKRILRHFAFFTSFLTVLLGMWAPFLIPTTSILVGILVGFLGGFIASEINDDAQERQMRVPLIFGLIVAILAKFFLEGCAQILYYQVLYYMPEILKLFFGIIAREFQPRAFIIIICGCTGAALLQIFLSDEYIDALLDECWYALKLSSQIIVYEIMRQWLYEHPRMRKMVIQAVGTLGETAATPEILAALPTGFLEDDSDVRQATIQAAGALGKSAVTPEFLSKLSTEFLEDDSDMSQVNAHAASALDSTVATPKFLAALSKGFRSTDLDIRQVVAQMVGALGVIPAGHELLASLAEGLREPGYNSRHVRQAAAQAVHALGVQDAIATPEYLAKLASGLEEHNYCVRQAAAEAINALGVIANTPQISVALGRILWKHGDDSRDVHRAAAKSPGVSGMITLIPEILTKLPLLPKEPVYGPFDVRRMAEQAIHTLGAEKEIATPKYLEALASGLQDSDSTVRITAAKAVCALGPVAVTPKILVALAIGLREYEDNSRYAHKACVQAIHSLGAEKKIANPEYLAEIVGGLQDSNSNVRTATKEAVGALGSVAVTSEMLAALARGLQGSNSDVQKDAAEVVGALGTVAATPEILAALAIILRNSNSDVRQVAAQTVGALGTVATTPEMLEALKSGFQDANFSECLTTVQALGDLGAIAATPEILAELANGLQESNASALWRVAHAVGALKDAAISSNYLNKILQEYKASTGSSYLFIMIYASLHQSLSVSVIRPDQPEAPETPYALRVISAQKNLQHPLTTLQAKILRHLIPEGVKLLLNHRFDEAVYRFKELYHDKRNNFSDNRTTKGLQQNSLYAAKHQTGRNFSESNVKSLRHREINAAR